MFIGFLNSSLRRQNPLIFLIALHLRLVFALLGRLLRQLPKNASALMPLFLPSHFFAATSDFARFLKHHESSIVFALATLFPLKEQTSVKRRPSVFLPAAALLLSVHPSTSLAHCVG